MAEKYWQLLGDLPHWLFELTAEAATFLAGVGLAWIGIKKHIHADVRNHEQKHHAWVALTTPESGVWKGRRLRATKSKGGV